MGIMDKFKLSGYCSIVTGGATGLGKAMADALAEMGSDIIIADLNLAQAERAAEEIKQRGVEVLAVEADVTLPADATRTVEQALQAFGKIDVLINNAGIVKNIKQKRCRLRIGISS
jgi:NAD(P)-dependent dehydrogenase (short-subunit alcohol dehydrogenase family)